MFVTSWLSSFDPGFGFQQKTYLQPWIGWHSITWVSSGVDFDFATSWKKLIFLTFSIEILCIFHAVLSRNKFQQNSVYFIPFNPISDKAKKEKRKKINITRQKFCQRTLWKLELQTVYPQHFFLGANSSNMVRTFCS